MTDREHMIRPGTTRTAGRAAPGHTEPPPRGWARIALRVAGGGLLIATAAIHLDLYLTGYRTIPTIGWLFLLQVIAAFGLGPTVLAVGRPALAGRLAAAAGAGFALTTLGGYLLTVWAGLFGFKEVRTTAGIVAGVVEVAAFAVLAALALAPARADSTTARAAFPTVIPPAIARTGAAAGAAVAAAALVLLGVAMAGAGSPAPAAAGAGLRTVTIDGTAVLANARGLTLYSFAPDTPTTSRCYGSCAAYWLPATGTATARPGLPGRISTITRTDRTRQ